MALSANNTYRPGYEIASKTIREVGKIKRKFELMKISFVILHYCLLEVTKDCVKSLLALDGNKDLVIVDNASPDGSGLMLRNYYENERRVHVLLNDKNGGFADGNNLGYRYAKSELESDCIIVLNNDTLIKDTDFLHKLDNIKDLSEYHIIAPDIVTYKGLHQNPYRMEGVSKDYLLKLRTRKKISLLFYSLPFLYKLKKNEVVNREGAYIGKRLEGIVAHGAAVIFSKKWIENEDFAFYPGTFMYYEEDLLYLYAQRKGYKTLYEPNLQITHLEDMSTNYSHKSVRKKMIFQDKLKIQSLNLIINFLNS